MQTFKGLIKLGADIHIKHLVSRITAYIFWWSNPRLVGITKNTTNKTWIIWKFCSSCWIKLPALDSVRTQVWDLCHKAGGWREIKEEKTTERENRFIKERNTNTGCRDCKKGLKSLMNACVCMYQSSGQNHLLIIQDIRGSGQSCGAWLHKLTQIVMSFAGFPECSRKSSLSNWATSQKAYQMPK